MGIAVPEASRAALRSALKRGLAREALRQKILTEAQYDRLLKRQGGP